MPDRAGVPLSGSEGRIVIQDNDGQFFVLDNSQYDLGPVGTAVTQMTLASGAGWSEAMTGGKSIGGVVVQMPDDSPSSVESAGCLQIGAVYNLWLRRGNADETYNWDFIGNTVFNSLKKTNPSTTGLARKIMLSFVGGYYLPYIEADDDVAAYLNSLYPMSPV